MLTIKHIELSEANAFVERYHRHHKKVTGHRFSVGAFDDGKMCGVAIAGSGTSTPINDIARLVNTYPSFGNADDWQKVVGVVNGTYFRYEVHWYECNGKVPVKEIKTKGVKSIR